MKRKKNRYYRDNGEPKYIRCYEIKKNPPIDRFTVQFTRASSCLGSTYIGRVYYLAMSEAPFHPQGFGQHGEHAGKLGHCGSVIKFSDLPNDCQKAVAETYAELWGERR